MMEDKINELEKLKGINKRRKILFSILLLILILTTVACSIQFVTLFKADNCVVCELTRQEIETFNSKFTSYVGDKKLGAQIKAVIAAVVTNNVNYQYQGGENRIVYVKMGDITGLDTREKWKNSDATCDTSELVNMRNKINLRRRYDITASYDEKGMIMGIGIIERPSDSDNTQITNNTNNI